MDNSGFLRQLRRWLPSALLAAGPATGAAPAATLEVGLGLVDANGYLQTPTGGRVGTASRRRPTLAEAGLGGGRYRWLAGSAELGRGRLRLRYAEVGADGTSALAAQLVSQGRAFGAGETIRSRASFDAIALGWTWTFEPRGWRVELGPQASWTDFHLRIDGASQAVDRRYHVHVIGALGIVSRQFGERVHASLEASAAPAVEGSGSDYALAPSIDYRFGAHLSARLGARFEAFGYDDAHKQALPNHLRVRRRLLPTLSIGARW